MSETVDRELMVLVERVVRPLPIPLSRQRRLRTEFLQHLQMIYAEELARDGDSVGAVLRTQERFGEPDSLKAELRGTIRWWERWEFWLEGNMAQRPLESAARYAFRMTGRFVLFTSSLLVLILLDHHYFGTERISLIKIQVGAAALAFLTVWFGCFLIFGLQAGVEWAQPGRRWSRIIPFSLCLLASWPISMALLMRLADGTWSEYSFPLALSIIGGLFSVLCGTVVGVLHYRDTAYRREWAALELEPA